MSTVTAIEAKPCENPAVIPPYTKTDRRWMVPSELFMTLWLRNGGDVNATKQEIGTALQLYLQGILTGEGFNSVPQVPTSSLNAPTMPDTAGAQLRSISAPSNWLV